MSSNKPTKKDKGKAIQKAEDYQRQLPVQNQFGPLAFPPIPYKQAVTNPTSSSSTNEYNIRFTEHLLLKLQTSTSHKYYFQHCAKIIWSASFCY